MSTLSDSIAENWTPAVEEFLYQDTDGRRGTSSGPAMSPDGKSKEKIGENNKLGHIPQEEISRLISEAHAEGVAQGERQAAAQFGAELERERKRLAELVVEFQRQRADYYAKVEIELVHLALAIAAKILHRESQVDRLVVAGLVKVMLERFQQNTRMVVRVRPEDVEAWTRYFGETPNLTVTEDRLLEPGGCLLETELGIANLALDAQLKEVEQGFFDLLARRPDPK